jgi:hypothetical protein
LPREVDEQPHPKPPFSPNPPLSPVIPHFLYESRRRISRCGGARATISCFRWRRGSMCTRRISTREIDALAVAGLTNMQQQAVTRDTVLCSRRRRGTRSSVASGRRAAATQRRGPQAAT